MKFMHSFHQVTAAGITLVVMLVATVSAQDFELIVGGTGQWPAAEGPENAINWEGQKYLNFERENSGFYIRPDRNAGETPTSITFWTANDEESRDPASFRLFGSSRDDLLSPLEYLPDDVIPFDAFTEITQGDLELPSTRNADGNAELEDFNTQTVDFANDTTYDNYLLVFPTVKDASLANSMQIAEVQLNYDGIDVASGIFDFDDEITGVHLLQDLPPIVMEPLAINDFKMVVGGAGVSSSWPASEGPENAINREGQKYLNFNREDTGVLVQPEGPNAEAAPTSITFWTANDAVDRDPASFRLLGSNSGEIQNAFDYLPEEEISLESFTEIAFGQLALPASRNEAGFVDLDDNNSQTIEFVNAEVYDHYVVVFPEVKNGETANSMQIAEIQLNYDGFDLESGVFDIVDAITGIALADINDIVDPIGPIRPIQPIDVSAFEILVNGNWPEGEDPEKAIDQFAQKYLNFDRENTGLLVRPEGENADEIATSITLWTANDEGPRDPASFRLFGSNSDQIEPPADYETDDSLPLDLFTEIAIGDIVLPAVRNEGGDLDLNDDASLTIEFENEEQFDTYLVVFPTVKAGESANSMQVAEIQLNYDGFDLESGIFDVFDEVAGVVLVGLEGICNPNTLGDTDGDGVVGFSDFLNLSGNFGLEVASHQQGDLDCNGVVEFADFLTLSSNFGNQVDGGVQSVPEPRQAFWLPVAALLLGLRKKRSHPATAYC